MRRKKKDLLKSKLQKLEQRKAEITPTTSEIVYMLKHADVDCLTKAFIGFRAVSDSERQKIRRFAEQAIIDPLAPVSDEFMDLPFVKSYMDKKEF